MKYFYFWGLAEKIASQDSEENSEMGKEINSRKELLWEEMLISHLIDFHRENSSEPEYKSISRLISKYQKLKFLNLKEIIQNLV